LIELDRMVALRGKDVDSFLIRPDPGRPIILLYGPDTGLVRERADALMASAVDDPNDPFSLVRPPNPRAWSMKP
jgi:DNA polymerase-3 subunit delta